MVASVSACMTGQSVTDWGVQVMGLVSGGRQGDLWSCACGYEKPVATDKDRLTILFATV